MNRRENTPVPYNGSQYTAYEASQRQRKLETTMRAERQKIKLLQDSGADEETIMLAKCRYRATSQEYTAFSKAMNLPEQRQRVYVDGLGNISKAKYTNVNKTIANSEKNGIINTNIKKINTGGLRNEIPLTTKQLEDVKNYAKQLGILDEQIRYGEHYNTSYGSIFDMLYIGTDVYPATNSKLANGRVTYKGAIAHEIVGHREACLKGWEQEDLVLDEIQASIRAARFAPDLLQEERIILLRDALERAKSNNISLQIIRSLHINER